MGAESLLQARRGAGITGPLAGVLDAGRSRAELTVADGRAAFAVPAVRRGVLASCLIVLGSFTPAFLPPDSPLPGMLGLGWMTTVPGRAVATAFVLVGMALLLHAWLALRPRPLRDGRWSRAPRATWWLWSLPFLAAPPLFSRDAYSYAAQGLIVDRGMDPYTTGPISVPGPFADQVDPMWLFTSAPYGPLALQTQHLMVDLTGGNAYLAAVAMRVPAFIAMAVIAAWLPRLAERLGGGGVTATWLGVINPLVLLHLVGGMHNDAMGLALAVVALAFAADGRLLPACLAMAGAVGYKQTAALAMVGVAGLLARHAVARARFGRTTSVVERRDILSDRAEDDPRNFTFTDTGRRPGDPEFGAYFRTAARVGLLTLAFFAVITWVCGLGWGWIAGLSVPMQVRSLLAPFTFVGSLGELLMRIFDASPAIVALPVTIAHALGYLTMFAGLAWTTLWLAPRRPALATVAAFAIFVLCGPVVHAWYVLPALVFLGTVRVTPALARIAIGITLFFGVYATFDVAVGNGAITLGVLALVGVLLRRRTLARLRVPGHRESPGAPSEAGAGAVRFSAGKLHATNGEHRHG